MYEIKRLTREEIVRNEGQPRKDFGTESLMELGQNMQAHGQLVPLIVYWCLLLKKFVLLDGERRWRAASLVGIKELDAIVLAERPTPAELRIRQLSIAVHRAELSLLERSDALAAIQKEENIGVGELADLVNLKQPAVTKLLSYQNGCDELKQLLKRNAIDSEKAYQICRESDLGKQRELLKEVPCSTRAGIQRRVNGNSDSVEAKVCVARFPMPGAALVTIQAKGLTLPLAIEIASENLRMLKKGHAQGLDIKTQQHVMRDTLKAKKQGTPKPKVQGE
jgi:ParB/RepB/Spo0J family partition protein